MNRLSSLKSLSLFYVLGDSSDLRALPGLTALTTLTIALEETLSNNDVHNLCTQDLQIFPSLKRLRIFSEDGMDYSFQYGGLNVDFAIFNFGDSIYLDSDLD